MQEEDMLLIWINDWCHEDFNEFIDYMKNKYGKKFHYSNIENEQ